MQETTKAVVLDGQAMNPGDLSWDSLEALTALTIHPRTPAEAVVSRSAGAEILIINKIVLGEAEFAALPKLKLVCITATGYDNVDLAAAAQNDILVCNVSGYSTEGVAQHVFALLLTLTNRVEAHDRSVQTGHWQQTGDFSYTLQAIPELAGKTLGVIGFGRIGQRVSEIGLAFGMQILANRRTEVKGKTGEITFTSRDNLLAQSDVVSLHTPLTHETEGMINARQLGRMKNTAYLINTGRGGLIEEEDLQAALLEEQIAGAALDVLSSEPPPADHPLFGLDNCLITPHLAWAGVASRQRLLQETVENVRAFLAGEPRNVIS